MKNSRPLALALLVSLAPVVAAPEVALAQQQADDASTKMARQRFQEGVAYFDKGQYELARASFLQAYALRKHPAVLLNLGLSSLKSGHPLESAKYLSQFLREHTGASVAQRNDADRGLREARQKLGRIDVAGAPPGTDLYVDDEKVGTMPLDTPADVEPGTHMVRAHGRLEDAVQITVNAGQIATARFGMSTPPAAVAPVPGPAAPAAATPSAEEPPPAPPASEASAPPEAAAPTEAAVAPASSRRGGAPDKVAPAVIGASITVAAVATAVTFYLFKNNAQSNADSVQSQIIANGGTTCDVKAPGYQAKFATWCGVFQTDRDRVNTDALVGNIALGVGIGAAAFTVGYWIFGTRSSGHATQEPAAQTSARPVVTPMVGKGLGGLAVGATF